MKKNNKVNPLLFFRKANETRQKEFKKSMKKFSLGGPPEGGDENSTSNSKGTKSADEYANMSRKEFRKEKKGVKRMKKIEDIKSGERAERTSKVIDAVGNIANAASTIVNATSAAKGIFEKQKMGGSVKRKRK